MHPKVLSEAAWKAVRKLDGAGLLEGWMLAGGTGLALQLGHRYSEDIALLSSAEFHVENLLRDISAIGKVQVQDRAPFTLHALIDGIRFSFLRAMPPLLYPGLNYRGLALADPRDIAVMKIIAIGGRGSRKDFVDLHFILKTVESLPSMFELLRRRFKRIDFNEYHLMKSLAYFEDAEREPLPEMIKSVSWEEVKRVLSREAARLAP